MDLEGIIQSEMRLTEMPKDMWNQENQERQKPKQNTKKRTHRCKKKK